MSKSGIITTVVAVAAVAAILWMGQQGAGKTSASASDSPRSNGTLVLSESSFDFGTVSMAKGVVRRSVTLKNEGPDPVVIGKMYTSCMCTTASFVKGSETFGPFGMQGHGYIPKINQTVGLNEEATVDVAFDPAAHGPAGVGRVDRSVYLENNAGKPIEIQFTATVTP